MADLENLLKEYAINKYIQYDFIFGNTIDFEKIVVGNVYDAIKLTDKGQVETRFSRNNLYGWDCESMVILNPDIIVNQKPYKRSE